MSNRWHIIAALLLIIAGFGLIYTSGSPTGAAIYEETVTEAINVSGRIPLRFPDPVTRLTVTGKGNGSIWVEGAERHLVANVSGPFSEACEASCNFLLEENATLIAPDIFIERINYVMVHENDPPAWSSNKSTFVSGPPGVQLNLDAYFTDPDGDDLTYLATGGEGVTTSVNGNQLLLTPQPRAIEANVTLIAVDAHSSTEKTITLLVEPGLDGVEQTIRNAEASIDPDVEHELMLGKTRVIVVLKRKAQHAARVKNKAITLQEKRDEARTAQESVRKEFGLSVSAKGQVEHTYENLNAMTVTVTEAGLETLAQHPRVASISVDRPFSVALEDSIPLINATLVQNISVNGTPVNGSGYGVCVIDTGLDQDHPAFTGRVTSGYDYVNNDANPEDDNGHGTHVSGIIATGMAPGSHIVPVKVCDSAGNCAGSDILAGIDHCINVTVPHNVSVISGSISDHGEYNSSTCPNFFDTSLQDALDLGLANVFASGNDGFTNGIAYPACSPKTIAVGATTKTDTVASFTSRGTLLDLLAPGSNINSTWLNGGWNIQSGTSQATPHVSGALVLLQQHEALQGRNYNHSAGTQALKNTGVMIDQWPRIDVYAAVNNISSSTAQNGSSGGNESGPVQIQGTASCGDTLINNSNLSQNLNCVASPALTIGGSNVELDCLGFTIGGTNGIQVNNGVGNVTVQNCVISSSGGDGKVYGIQLDTNENITIQHNTFNISHTGTTTFHAGVQALATCRKNLVFNNTFIGAPSSGPKAGVRAESFTGLCTNRNLTIRQNTFANLTAGVQVVNTRSSLDVLIQNNSATNVTIANNSNVDLKDQPTAGFTLQNTNISRTSTQGSMRYLQPVTASGSDLTGAITLSKNFIDVNTSLIPELSQPARITFYDVTLNRPAIRRNGSACPVAVCTQESFTSDFTFNVTGFTNFTLTESINASLNSTTGRNLTTDNLTMRLQGDTSNFKNITVWFRNSVSQQVLVMPFENGTSNGTFTQDYTPFEHNGTVNGSQFKPGGGFDGRGAYAFDGIDDAINLDTVSNSQTGTIMAWVSLSESGGSTDNNIFSQSNATDSFNYLRFAATDGNNVSLDIDTRDCLGDRHILVSAQITQGAWHHVAVTSNGTNYTFYIDGAAVPHTTSAGSSIGDWFGDLCRGTEKAHVGRWVRSGTDQPYNGSIDDLQVWNRSLSPQQIAAIYRNRTDLIVSQETQIGDTWSANVTPNDGVDDGGTLQTNDVTIIADTPVITSAILNTTPAGNLTSQNLTLHLTVTDPKASGVKNITVWYVDGISQQLLHAPFENGTSDDINTKDYTPFGKNGTVDGAAYNESGGFDERGSYVFASPAMINFTNDPLFNFTRTSTFSFEIRVLTGNDNGLSLINAFPRIIDKQSLSAQSTDQGYGLILVPSTDADGGKVLWDLGNTTTFDRVTSTKRINDSKWHHLIGVKNATHLELFIDGVSQGTAALTVSDNVTNNRQLRLGSYNTTRGLFNGSLDEFRIWNRSLTQQQILVLNSTTDRIHSAESRSGDVWHVNTTPNDGTEDGLTVQSNEVTIITPQQQALLNSTTGGNLSTENLTAHAIAFPDFGDSRLIYDWNETSTNDIIEVGILPFEVNVGSAAAGAIRNYALGTGNGTLGNGSAGTLPTYTRRNDNLGGGYQFDGINDVVNLTSASAYAMSSSFSIEIWFNVSATSTNESKTLFQRHPGGSSAKNNYLCTVGEAGNPSKTLRPRCQVCDGVSCSIIEGDTNVTPDRISHLVFSHADSANELRLYLNGTLIKTKSSTIKPATSAMHLTLGAQDRSPGAGIQPVQPFNGSIYHLTLYNRSLSAVQIRANFHRGAFKRNVTTLGETQPGENWSATIRQANTTLVGTASASNDVTILSGDTVPPTVTNVTPQTREVPIFNSTTITANVTDNILVDTVQANVTLPSGQAQIIVLTGTGDIQSGLFTNTQLTGQYNITIIATDVDSNINNTEIGAFNVTVGNLSCRSVDSTTCAVDETRIMGFSNITNAHAQLANQTPYDFSVCCKDTSGINNISNTTGFNVLDLSNLTNAHVERPNIGNYDYEAFIGGSRDQVLCEYDTLSFGSCKENRTCVVTIPENETGEQTNLHVASCDTSPYSTSVCCGMGLGNRYIPPREASVRDQFTANSSFSGILQNGSRAGVAQTISYTNDTLGKRLDITGLFNESDVNATELIIEADENSTFVNVSITGDAITHTIRIPDSNDGIGAVVCPDATNLTTTVPGCTNEIRWTEVELGTFKSGLNMTLGGTYILSNSTLSGVAPLAQTADLNIFDDTDPEQGSQVRYKEEQVFFFANYTNVTDGSPIDEPGVFCNISGVNISATTMSFNSTSGFYEHNQTFAQPSVREWNATCDGTAAGYNLRFSSDTVNISVDDIVPEVVNVTPQNGFFNFSDNVTLRANVTDNNAVDSVRTVVAFPSGDTQTVTMAREVGDLFNVTFTNTSLFGGEYTFTIVANDTSNNLNDSVEGGFNLTGACGIPVIGSFVLTRDLTVNGTCLTFTANDATVDCQDHSITGNGTGMGMNITRLNGNTIQNCRIDSFATSILQRGAVNTTIINTTLNNNSIGIELDDSRNMMLSDSLLVNGSSYAIRGTNSSGNDVNDTILRSNGAGILFNGTANNTLRAVVLSDSGGLTMKDGAEEVLTNISIRHASTSIELQDTTPANITLAVVDNSSNIGLRLLNSSNITLRNSTISNTSTFDGISTFNSSRVHLRNNTILNSFRHGIQGNGGQGWQIVNNTIKNTSEGRTITLNSNAAHAVIEANFLHQPDDHGILLFDNVTNVTIRSNRVNNSGARGISFSQNSTGHTITDNNITDADFGIFGRIGSSGTIRDNHVTGARIGLAMEEGGATIVNNTLANVNISLDIQDTLNITFGNQTLASPTTFRNSSFGDINYTSTLTITGGFTLLDVMTISNNTAFVNSTQEPALNESAVLRFLQVSHPQPKPWVDVEDNGVFTNCPVGLCPDNRTSGSTYEYNVSHFTTFNVTEGVVVSVLPLSPDPSSPRFVNIPFTIRANVTDNQVVDNVWANVTKPSGEVVRVDLSLDTPDIYAQRFDDTSSPGNYVVQFFANDTHANLNSTTDPLSITYVAKPLGGGGSGGLTRPARPPAPVAPVTPVTPIAPVAPVAPIAPVSPIGPPMTQVPQAIGIPLSFTDLQETPLTCAYLLNGAAENVTSHKGSLRSFQIPAGYEVASDPFTFSCGGERVDLTASVPHTYTDLQALRCTDDGCTRISAQQLSQEDMVCGGRALTELRMEELLARDPYLDPSDFSRLTPYEKAITRDTTTIAIGEHSLTFKDVTQGFSARVASPQTQLPQPANPNAHILGTPLLVHLPEGTYTAEVHMPYVLPDGIDPHTLGIYAQQDGQWIRQETDISPDRLSAEVSLSGEQVLAVIGTGCEACTDVQFKKLYDPGSRKAIVLIHGFMSNPDTWQFLLDDFRLNHQPYQLWSLAYPGSMTLENITSKALDLLQARAGAYDEIQFVGHSLGAFVAQEALHQADLQRKQYTFVEKVDKAILVGSPNDGSPAAAQLGELWSKLINAKSTETIFDPASPMVQDLQAGRHIPRADGVEYKVIAGTQPYALEVAGISFSTAELFGLLQTNDGITTTRSAQHVGDIYVDKLCQDYFEVNVSHTELINDPAARKTIERLLTQDLYGSGGKAAGYLQYFRFQIDTCNPEAQYVIIGKPIDEAMASGVLNCKCGNGVCGVDETPENCPVDCGVARSGVPGQWIAATIFLLLLIWFVYRLVPGLHAPNLTRHLPALPRPRWKFSLHPMRRHLPAFSWPRWTLPKMHPHQIRRHAKERKDVQRELQRLEARRARQEQAMRKRLEEVRLKKPGLPETHLRHERPASLQKNLRGFWKRLFRKRKKIDINELEERLKRLNRRLK